MPEVDPRMIEGKTRKDVVVPAWVENAMHGRWGILILAGIIGGISQLWWIWALGVLSFLAVGHFTYKSYHKEDPVSAEIVFNNETDGFNSGDGDGDGGD